MPIANENDRERARRFLARWLDNPSGQGSWDADVSLLAQSYAEVREEAEKEIDCKGAACTTPEDPCWTHAVGTLLAQVDSAHRAGMEEAARIAESYEGDVLGREVAEAIRAAMKEGGCAAQ